MADDREHELLTKALKGRLTPTDRRELMDALHMLEQDETRPIGDRMGAIVLRASLLAKAVVE